MSGRVWVTGASGMLGRVLVPYLAGLGWAVTPLSRTGGEKTTALDLSDAESTSALFLKEKPQVVIHAAAYSDVDGCERDPERARAANAHSTRNLAGLCGRAGAPLVYVSTDYVFDGKKTGVYKEDDATFPINIYGLTKLEGEWHAASCAAGAAIVRTSWLFGGPNPSNFVNAILTRLKKDKAVSVLDDQTDCPTSVKDLSTALEKIAGRLLAAKKAGPPAVYHICNKGATTRLDMTRFFQKELKLPVDVQCADRSSIQNRIAVRPAHSVMSCSRFEKEFGVLLRPWQDAAREFLVESAACVSS